MNVQIVKTTEPLSNMKVYPDNVGHVFAAKGDKRIFLMTLIVTFYLHSWNYLSIKKSIMPDILQTSLIFFKWIMMSYWTMN